MNIFSFSIRDSKNKELQEVKKIKKYCDIKGISFSHVIIESLMQFVNNGGLDE